MKSHKIVKLTREHLEWLKACNEGLKAILPLLPLSLSTDPEQNIDLAIKIACSPRAKSGWWDAAWLVQSLGRNAPPSSYLPDSEYYQNDLQWISRAEPEDVYLTMQYLAMAADILDRLGTL